MDGLMIVTTSRGTMASRGAVEMVAVHESLELVDGEIEPRLRLLYSIRFSGSLNRVIADSDTPVIWRRKRGEKQPPVVPSYHPAVPSSMTLANPPPIETQWWRTAFGFFL
jgi:hypothetical protein